MLVVTAHALHSDNNSSYNMAARACSHPRTSKLISLLRRAQVRPEQPLDIGLGLVDRALPYLVGCGAGRSVSGCI